MRKFTKDETFTKEQIEAFISAQPFKGNIEEPESNENKQFAEDVNKFIKPTNITPKKKKRK